ncbi:MAG: hypothetical protein AUJ85_02895 [Elusimicrobia bacterium CG1_02_37_114]
MLKKLLTILGIIAAIVVTLLVILVVVLRTTFPPEKIKSIVEGQFRHLFNREISIKSISLNFPGEIKISGIKISDKPDFNSGIFVESEYISLKLKLKPLLKGMLKIDKIEISKPKIKLIKEAGKNFNFSLKELSGMQKTGFIPDTSFILNRIELKDGELSFSDAGKKDSVSISVKDIDLIFNNFNLNGPFPGRISGNLDWHKGRKEFSGYIAFNSKINIARESIEIVKFNVKMKSGETQVTGKLEGFSKPKFDIRIVTDPKTIKEYQKLLPGLKWFDFDTRKPAELNIKGTPEHLKIS